MIKKLRQTLTKEQRFQRALQKFPGEDPFFPVIMHSLERKLAGIKDCSSVDTIVRKTLVKYPLLTDKIIQTWVKNWNALPQQMKSKFVPLFLQYLKVEDKLNMKDFNRFLSKLINKNMPQASFLFGSRLPKSAIQKIDFNNIHINNNIKIESITPTDPDGYPYITLGQKMTIKGHGFSVENANNNIFIIKITNEIIIGEFGIFPVHSTESQLEVFIPVENELAPGKYGIYVSVRNSGSSNLMTAQFVSPIKESAKIDFISPESQVPSGTVLITGSRFVESSRIFWTTMEDYPDSSETYNTSVEYLDDSHLKLIIPERMVFFPGRFLISVAGENQKMSDPIEFMVRPHKYRLIFNRITCLDESNPEWWGDDEIVARWVIACDPLAWSKQSKEYTGFKDGTVKEFDDNDKTVFLPDGATGEVKKGLVVGTMLWEWDEGDVESWNQALDFISDAVGKIFKGTWAEYLKYVFLGISKLVSWFGGDPDSLGERDIIWTAAEMQEKTNNPDHKFEDSLSFLNDSDTGSYKLNYTLWRIE
jgi:hypothetical protein